MCGRPSCTLFTRRGLCPLRPAQSPCRGSHPARSPVQQFCRQVHHAFFIAFAHGKNARPCFFMVELLPSCALANAQRRCGPRPSLPRWSAFLALKRVNTREFIERQHHFFHRVVGGITSLVTPCSASDLPAITRPPLLPAVRRWLWRRTERYARTRVNFNQVDFVVFHRKLHVIRPRTCNSKASFCTCWRITSEFPDLRCRLAENMRSHRSAPRLLDVLHDAANQHHFAVADASTSTSTASSRK